MSKLIDVDKIDWQKGVFVNPNTEEPLSIIHKIATIEMLRDWQEEVKAIPLDKVEKARDEIKDGYYGNEEKSETDSERADAFNNGLSYALEILDKLIAESEEKK